MSCFFFNWYCLAWIKKQKNSPETLYTGYFDNIIINNIIKQEFSLLQVSSQIMIWTRRIFYFFCFIQINLWCDRIINDIPLNISFKVHSTRNNQPSNLSFCFYLHSAVSDNLEQNLMPLTILPVIHVHAWLPVDAFHFCNCQSGPSRHPSFVYYSSWIFFEGGLDSEWSCFQTSPSSVEMTPS